MPEAPIVIVASFPPVGFRVHLLQALLEGGHEAYYLDLKRRPVLYTNGKDAGQEMSIWAAMRRLAEITRGRPDTIFVNATTVSFPLFSIFMQAWFGGVWVYDMHDDFIYGRTGLAWLRAAASQGLLIRASDVTVRSAGSIVELAPKSVDLPFASHVRRRTRSNPDFSRVLIIANFEQRTDIAFIAETARLAPERHFDLVGATHFTPVQAAAFQAMLDAAPNVSHLGRYKDSELDEVLSAYDVTLAPYVQNHRDTRYIDPIRYRHAINSGMEVVTTDVPSAHQLENLLHIVRTPAEAAATLDRLGREPSSRRVIGRDVPTFEWKVIAERLLQIAAPLQRGKRHRSSIFGRHMRAENAG